MSAQENVGLLGQIGRVMDEPIETMKKRKKCICCGSVTAVIIIICTVVALTVSMKTTSSSTDPPHVDDINSTDTGSVSAVQRAIVAMDYGSKRFSAAIIDDTNRRTDPKCFDPEYPTNSLTATALQGIIPWSDTPSLRVSDGIDAYVFHSPYRLGQNDVWPNAKGEITLVPFEYAISNTVRQNSALYVRLQNVECMSYNAWLRSTISLYGITSDTNPMPEKWRPFLDIARWKTFQTDAYGFDHNPWWQTAENTGQNRHQFSGLFRETVYAQVYASQSIYGTQVVRIEVPPENVGSNGTVVKCVLDYRRSYIYDTYLLSTVQKGSMLASDLPSTHFNNGMYRQVAYPSDWLDSNEKLNAAVHAITQVRESMVCEAKFGIIGWARNALIVRRNTRNLSDLLVTENLILTTTYNQTSVNDVQQTVTVNKSACNLILGTNFKKLGSTTMSLEHSSVILRECLTRMKPYDGSLIENSLLMWNQWPITMYGASGTTYIIKV
jgi:hypothetical protein